MIRSNPTASLPNGSPDRGRQVLGIVLQNHPTLMQEAYDAFFKADKGSAEAIQAANKLDLFLKQDGSANQLTSDRKTPATKAIAHDRPWLFRRLAKTPDFQPDALSQGHYPAIHTAILKGNQAAFNQLLAAMAKRNLPIQPETLELAANCGQPKMLAALLMQKAQKAKSKKLSRIWNYFLPSNLLAQKASVNLSAKEEEIARLQDLALRQQKELQRLRRAPQNDLQAALILGRRLSLPEACLLLQVGEDVNRPRYSLALPSLVWDAALHRAVMENSLGVIQALIASGADVNQSGPMGQTPLHWAAKYDYSESVRTLIEAGAEVNQPDHKGQTPLHLATEQGHPEIARVLIEAGAV